MLVRRRQSAALREHQWKILQLSLSCAGGDAGTLRSRSTAQAQALFGGGPVCVHWCEREHGVSTTRRAEVRQAMGDLRRHYDP